MPQANRFLVITRQPYDEDLHHGIFDTLTAARQWATAEAKENHDEPTDRYDSSGDARHDHFHRPSIAAHYGSEIEEWKGSQLVQLHPILDIVTIHTPQAQDAPHSQRRRSERGLGHL